MAETPPATAGRPEAETAVPVPRIYVACLAAYNAGWLHGTWIDAHQDADELGANVREMLARSPVPMAEEFAIHDYEGFGGLVLSEYESLERVAQLARGIALHGEAFAAWASLDAAADVGTEAFEEAYRGTWNSVDAYAEDFLEEMGANDYLTKLPDWLQPYVRLDSGSFGHSLVIGGDIAAVEGVNGVHIFDRHV